MNGRAKSRREDERRARNIARFLGRMAKLKTHLSVLLIASLIPMAFGIAADLWLVAWRVLHSLTAGIVTAAIAFMWMLWFGVSLSHRSRVRARTQREAHA